MIDSKEILKRILQDIAIKEQVAAEMKKIVKESFYDGDMAKERYWELHEELARENAEDTLYEMVERDYDPEKLAEMLKNPNEW
jgi:hypothetical protein